MCIIQVDKGVHRVKVGGRLRRRLKRRLRGQLRQFNKAVKAVRGGPFKEAVEEAVEGGRLRGRSSCLSRVHSNALK